jgi:protein disulfide-isomerase A1
MALRRIALCIPLLMLALAPLYVSTADVVDEPIEYVEEDGRKIPVLKATNAEDYDDSDVFVLTGDNFKETIGKHKHILVEFYAPWCGHCKQLKPEYGAAAKRLKRTHPDVVLAKFDAVADGAQAITKEFTVEGFPTMKWFVDGVAHPKDCQVREEADLVKWVVKKTSPPVKAVLNEDDMALLKSTDTRFAVVGFFDDIESKEFKTFAELAMHDDRYDFHFVADATMASGEGVSKMPAVIFYRNFDEPKVTYDKEFSAVDLADAVRTNARPRLIEMSEETAPLIFDNDLDKLLLFRPGTGVAMAEFTRASGDKELRGRYIFAAVGDKGDPGLAEFMGVRYVVCVCVCVCVRVCVCVCMCVGVCVCVCVCV